MEYETIGKEPADKMAVTPNLPDVDAARRGFQWTDMYKEIDWLPGGYLNQAHECIDRHVAAGHGDQLAPSRLPQGGDESGFGDLRRAEDAPADSVPHR